MGYRLLGRRVILRAFFDALGIARSKGPVEIYQDEARQFLTRPSADLTFWCELADVPAMNVVAAGRRLETRGWSLRRSKITLDLKETKWHRSTPSSRAASPRG